MEKEINKTWVILMAIGVLLVIGVSASFAYFGVTARNSEYDSGPNFNIGINTTATGVTVTRIKDIKEDANEIAIAKINFMNINVLLEDSLLKVSASKQLEIPLIAVRSILAAA